MAAAPVIGGSAALALTDSRELVGVIDVINADDTPPESITEVISMATTSSVLRHVAEHPVVQRDLQLTSVTPEIWNEVKNIVDRLNTANSVIEKARVYGDLVQLSSTSIELTTFINELHTLSRGHCRCVAPRLWSLGKTARGNSVDLNTAEKPPESLMRWDSQDVGMQRRHSDRATRPPQHFK